MCFLGIIPVPSLPEKEKKKKKKERERHCLKKGNNVNLPRLTDIDSFILSDLSKIGMTVGGGTKKGQGKTVTRKKKKKNYELQLSFFQAFVSCYVGHIICLATGAWSRILFFSFFLGGGGSKTTSTHTHVFI